MTTFRAPSSSAIALIAGRLVPASGSADSVLLIGDEIAAVGSARDILSRAPEGAKRIELRGRIVTAGFQDGHMHFLSTGFRARRPDLSGSRSVDDALDIVRCASREQNDDEVLVAEAWDETNWVEADLPTRALLDSVVPNRPVVLRRVCGHAAVANGAALRWLLDAGGGDGIDVESGLLLESAILSLDSLLRPSARETNEAIDAATRLCLERGITTACDFLRPGDPAAWALRLGGGELSLRVHGYLVEADEEDAGLAEIARERDTFFLEGTKIFADGSIGARTAALGAPYADRPDSRGLLLLDADTIATWVARAHRRERAIAVHAIGDRAIGAVLEAFSHFDPDECRARHDRLEHLELPRPGDAERLAALGVRPCMQPNFVARWGFPGSLYERALGAERVRAMNPSATVHRAGCGLFFGSDGMPLSPLYGIAAAMTHPVENERLGEAEAVALYTRAPALAFADDSPTGSLAQGMAADLCVLPEGFRWEEATSDTRTDLTIVAGRIVHESAPFASAARAALA